MICHRNSLATRGKWRCEGDVSAVSLTAHSNLAHLFRNRYETSWAAALDHGSVRGPLAVAADQPTTLYRPYNEVKQERDIFKDHPRLPDSY